MPSGYDDRPTAFLKDFHYADRRDNQKTGRINYRYIRFIPSKETQELIFRDSGRDGEKLLMNFVRIAPYFPE